MGYDFEQLVLYATSFGLGTCWLGGAFNRNAFTSAMEMREGQIFPILSPIGDSVQTKSLLERIMRRSIKADERLSKEELFFQDDFGNSLSEEKAHGYEFP